jgi:type IV pilus assembly protein PilQ
MEIEMMRKWTKSAGILFLAASAVFPGIALGDSPKGGKNANVRLLDEAADPVPVPSTQPATQPSDKATVKQSAGQSVTASQVNVSDAGTVEIHVNDASLVEVLRMLSLQSQKNIIASKDVHGAVTANLYDVTVREALDAILKANGYDYREKGNFIFVYTAKEIADMEKAARVKKTEVIRLFYTPAANVVTMLKPVLSSDGQVAFTAPAGTGIDAGTSGGAAGGGAGGGDSGGNSHATEDMLVISDYPENLDAVRKIVKELDRRPVQILVEAVILRATLNDTNSLGIDFTALGGVDFNTLGNLGTGTSGTTGGTSGGTSGSTINGTGLQQAQNGQIMQNGAAGKINDSGFVSVATGGNGLQLGFVKNNIGVFISALEGVTDTVVLANPKLLVLNKQRGMVQVGSQLGYRTAITTETATADDVKFLDTGTVLSFRPYIGDNGYIRMEIHPEDSSGSIDSNGLPSKFVTQITSNIMVQDGKTIVIGGLFRESTTRSRSQVPFLGSLPGAGLLFRHQSDQTVREEDIILLTPHIVKDDQQYSEFSEQELKQTERIRVGMRRGLMPWGRERLAESWYQNAVTEMNKPHPDRQKALFHLNCAIQLNPKFAEAIEMRSQISGTEMTAVDNSTIRHFVKNQIMAERANPTTMPSHPQFVPIEATRNDFPNQGTPGAKPAMQTQAEAPATQPTVAQGPTDDLQVAAAPTTQPVAQAPTTQPVASAPTTQPSPDVVNADVEPILDDEDGIIDDGHNDD